MGQRRSSSRPTSEPIRNPWLWVAFVALILAMAPWYLPAGDAAPLVFGVPYWFPVSVAATLLFSGVAAWACLRRWNLDEPEEERRAAEAAARHDGDAPDGDSEPDGADSAGPHGEEGRS
ncbi:hypothetical protein LY13_001727 [Prauserella aidingensis]|uniref:hypothetical protein n=1 Tax=Prauserella aidingensis TaxID=387890 RepID=UPI0020A3D326|nr:hypothetical protein [Prauserella aidingensis]MCP2252983.1 hypothetical protein [Prauserella aidingensis]